MEFAVRRLFLYEALLPLPEGDEGLRGQLRLRRGPVRQAIVSEDAPAAEAEKTDAEEIESEDDYSAVPTKPSHLEFGKSTISEGDMSKLMSLGYFSEAEKELVRFGGEETTSKPEKDEVVVFKSFYKAGLRFPLNGMIADVLKKFGIYLHQLTPNAIVRLSVYIWALRS